MNGTTPSHHVPPKSLKKPSKLRRNWVRILLASGAVIIFAQLHQVQKSSNELLCLSSTSSSTTNAAGWVSPNKVNITTTTRLSGKQKADMLLSKTYNTTFRFLVDTCNKNESLQTCAGKHNNNNHTTSTPWWFQTLMRDASNFELNAYWHTLVSFSPPMRMCTIEKVATSQWRKVFARLKQNTCRMYDPVRADCCAFAKKMCFPNKYNDKQMMTTTTTKFFQFVFLRDPLERFLSAYLNKCVSSKQDRRWCKPTAVFTNMSSHQIIHTNKQQMFGMYVDTMPISWDLHFFPQSLYCNGLYREIHTNYDFVGKMNSEFFQYLEQMVSIADSYQNQNQKNSSRVRNLVTEIFETRWDIANNRNKKMGGDNNNKLINNQGTETKAPSRVLEYYTPSSLRRVLQYTALDYLTLPIDIPEWAIQMLEQE